MGLVKISQSGGGGDGTVTSVGVSVPQPTNPAFSVSNSPIISTGTIAITTNGLANQYIDGTGALRNSVAFTGVGTALATIPNPSAIRYLRVDANNSVSTLTAAQLKADLGFITQAQTSNLSNSSSSVGVNITGCVVTIDANSTYVGKITIASGSVPVTGYGLTFTFPSGATVLVGRISSSSTTAQIMQWQTATSGGVLSTNFGTAQNQVGYTELQLSIVVGATGGTLVPSFVSGTNGSAITIYGGLTSIALQKI